jgi:hypothetical protein
MRCPRCGKDNPADVHTCTAPPAIYLAEQIEAVYEAPHLPRKAAAELRKQHEEIVRLEQALKMEHLNYLGCMEDLKEAEKAQPTLTVEALRQDFERQYKGHIGTTRMESGRYLSPSIDDAWKAYARQFIQPQPDHFPDAGKMVDDTAMLRQALYLIEAWERGAESADYWFEIAALRERLKS